MKTQPSRLGFSIAKTAAVLALALFAAATPAKAALLSMGIDLGYAGRPGSGYEWAIFTLSGGLTITDTTSQTPIPAVQGNVGAAGGGNITLSGTTKVVGTAYIRSGGVLRKSGSASITGNGGAAVTDASHDAILNSAVTSAMNASAFANGLSNQDAGINYNGWNSLTTVNQNTSLSLTDTTAGQHAVLHLTDFVLTGGATFTLSGSAATAYVIDVSNNFSLIGGKVLLAGGLLPENVLFNITGTGTTVSMSSAAQYNGFLLAPNRTVNISGASNVSGTIIAQTVNVSGGSRLSKPTYTSP